MQSRLLLIFCLSVAVCVTNEVYAQKYGYVNSREILNEIPEVKEANANLDAFKLQLQKKGQEMVQALQEKAKELERKQASGEISPKQLEEEAKKLQEEEEKIREFERTSQEKLYKKGEELLKPIQDKANAALKQLAQEGGYDYIFDSGMGIILYADESTNLNQKLKAKLQ